MQDEYQFYLVIPPGFEKLALAELREKNTNFKLISEEHGGLEIALSLFDGLNLNRELKIPNLVLLRVAKFKCRDLPKLYNKISNIKWSNFLIGSDFEVHVTSRKSRLQNEKKIAASVREGILRHFVKQQPKKVERKKALEVYVRFDQDECQISLNTSGELLFKRGYKTMTGVAPIRENLAAGLYYALKRELGVASDAEIVDPMCGSGTLLLEAKQFYEINKSREYDFEFKWVDCAPRVQNIEFAVPKKLIAIDKERNALEALQMTLQALSENDSSQSWGLLQQDFLSTTYADTSYKNAVFICNPPYGERIRLPESPRTYYNKLMLKIAEAGPRGFGVIVPKSYLRFVDKDVLGYTRAQIINFSHGGLLVGFCIYKPKIQI